MENAKRQYILTQGPLPSTTSHFWLMVWEQRCKAVVMLNRVMEKNQVSVMNFSYLTCLSIDNVLKLYVQTDQVPSVLANRQAPR